MNKLPYGDARRIRLEGRKAAWDGQARLSRFAMSAFPGWWNYDREWCRGYDEAAKAPHVAWFRPDGSPWLCGGRTKAGAPCRVVVDRRGSRCARHRGQPVQLALPLRAA
jgi:hypothetical protein